MSRPFGAGIVGDPRTGRLYGRGACDRKAGVAATVAAAQTVAAQGTAGDVILARVTESRAPGP